MAGRQLRCAIHQPNLFPRLVTLSKIRRADVWVVLTQVQFAGRDYQNRFTIAPLQRPRDLFWATVPVNRPLGRASRIDDVTIVRAPATAERLARQLSLTYGRSQYRDDIHHIVSDVLRVLAEDRLADAAVASTERLLRRVGWRGDVRIDTEFLPRTERTARLVDLVRDVGGTIYLCGPGGRSYLRTEEFRTAGLGVEFVEPAAVQVLGLEETTRDRRSSLDYVARLGGDGLAGVL